MSKYQLNNLVVSDLLPDHLMCQIINDVHKKGFFLETNSQEKKKTIMQANYIWAMLKYTEFHFCQIL